MPNNSNSIIARLGGEVYEFMFGEDKYSFDPAEDIPIYEQSLNEEYAEQPAKYAYVSMLFAKADARLRIAKLEVEEAEARAYGTIRKVMIEEGDKITESAINKNVVLNSSVMKANRTLIMVQTDHTLLKELEEVFKMRAEMLVRLGAMQRAEMSMTGMETKSSNHRKSDPVKEMKDALMKNAKIVEE